MRNPIRRLFVDLMLTLVAGSIWAFSVQPLCSQRLRGGILTAFLDHRETENTLAALEPSLHFLWILFAVCAGKYDHPFANNLKPD